MAHGPDIRTWSILSDDSALGSLITWDPDDTAYAVQAQEESYLVFGNVFFLKNILLCEKPGSR